MATKASLLRRLSTVLMAGFAAFCVFKAFSVAYDQYRAIQDLPHNEELPVFDPHRPDFTCEIEAKNVPPVDAQADAWFREAQALDDHDLWEEDRDYRKIVQLTRQAADRRHWKAMLNLATLYLEKRDPPNGEMAGRPHPPTPSRELHESNAGNTSTRPGLHGTTSNSCPLATAPQLPPSARPRAIRPYTSNALHYNSIIVEL